MFGYNPLSQGSVLTNLCLACFLVFLRQYADPARTKTMTTVQAETEAMTMIASASAIKKSRISLHETA